MRKLKSINHDYCRFFVNPAFQWNGKDYFQPRLMNITILHYQWLETFHLSQCTWFYSSTYHALFLASLHFHFSACFCLCQPTQRIDNLPLWEICLYHAFQACCISDDRVKRVYFLLTCIVSVFSLQGLENFSLIIFYLLCFLQTISFSSSGCRLLTRGCGSILLERARCKS